MEGFPHLEDRHDHVKRTESGAQSALIRTAVQPLGSQLLLLTSTWPSVRGALPSVSRSAILYYLCTLHGHRPEARFERNVNDSKTQQRHLRVVIFSIYIKSS